jgi:hypothetical protein
MSRVQLNVHRKKLTSLLSKAPDENFLQLVWAIDALQSDRVEDVEPFITFPAAAATPDHGAKFAIRKWELETLVHQLLIVPKAKPGSGKNRYLNCTLFDTASKITNHLRKVEDNQAGFYLRHLNVLYEMHRIGQRQFPWQRGFYNAPQLYRYGYIYGQGQCAEYFNEQYGISYSDFTFVGFCLHAGFFGKPWLPHTFHGDEVGLTRELVAQALPLLSMPIGQARLEARKMTTQANEKHGKPLPIAYRPSFLRRFPIISFGGDHKRLRAPVVQLIPLRCTSGVYYDLVGGGAHLRNEAAGHFEQYCRDYIAATFPELDIQPAHKYRVAGNDLDSPDIIIKDCNRVSLVVECKATKLSFPAQFADDPINEAKVGYEEISKGVYQLWRYFSHARRGLVLQHNFSDEVHGLVLTLDTWLQMSGELQVSVIEEAERLARADPEITAVDRRKVAFVSIVDFENMLTRATKDSLFGALRAAQQEQYQGWLLPNIHNEVGGENADDRPFPFDLGDVLPWWAATDALRARLTVDAAAHG